MNDPRSSRQPWTRSVATYHAVTSSTRDVLRHNLLVPKFLDFIGNVTGLHILDVGCGDGTFLMHLQSSGADVAGLDASEEMIRHATQILPQVPLICHDITQPIPAGLGGDRFDGITANMVFHCIDAIETVPSILARCLKQSAWVAFSILHPAFHQSPQQIQNLKRLSEENRTWQFEVNSPYLTPRIYQKPIADSDVIVTNHHRPIRDYVNIFAKAGYVIDAVDEPLLTQSVNRLPRTFHATLIPRFLFVRARYLHQDVEGSTHSPTLLHGQAPGSGK